MPLIMNCGFCKRGIARADSLSSWGESCKRCNGKGEIVVLHPARRYKGAEIANAEVADYQRQGFKVTY
jgi:hypothetical protein